MILEWLPFLDPCEAVNCRGVLAGFVILPFFTRVSIRYCALDPVVRSVKEYERRIFFSVCETLHMTDENEMVATGVLRFLRALEPGATVFDQRYAP